MFWLLVVFAIAGFILAWIAGYKLTCKSESRPLGALSITACGLLVPTSLVIFLMSPIFRNPKSGILAPFLFGVIAFASVFGFFVFSTELFRRHVRGRR